jgi:hypothetical protein
LNIVRQRLNNERLIGAPFSAPEDAVQWFGAVQAQDFPAAKWGVGQRVKNCIDADVDEPYQAGKFLRTHVMRPTWHFVMPEDIRWMQELTAVRVKMLMAPYDRKLELDASVFKASNAALVKALSGGQHLMRSEVAKVLEGVGIHAAGQRLGHLIMRAELEALICSGVMRGKQHTYALVDERAPKARTLTRDEALAELARRYFTSHGPALPQDFAGWSGLTVADARSGIEMAKSHLLHEVVDGKTYWFAPPASNAKITDPTLHLLPNYDEYLIAYRDHSPLFEGRPPMGTPALYDVLSRHIVVLNGRVIGGWRRTLTAREVTIETNLLVPLADTQDRALHDAAADYGRFLGKSVTVRPGRW